MANPIISDVRHGDQVSLENSLKGVSVNVSSTISLAKKKVVVDVELFDSCHNRWAGQLGHESRLANFSKCHIVLVDTQHKLAGQLGHESRLASFSTRSKMAELLVTHTGVPSIVEILGHEVDLELKDIQRNHLFFLMIRYAGCKCVVVWWPDKKGDSVKLSLRPSMNKFESKHTLKMVMNLYQMLVDTDVAFDVITASCVKSGNTTSIMLAMGVQIAY
nr:hypothetical protein [Tanacetum cinerariifolium]